MDGVFKSLIVKDVDRKKAVFYVVQFVGCNQWASWPHGDILRLFQMVSDFS